MPLLESSVPALARAATTDGEHMQIALVMGSALMFAGRHAEADTWMREERVIAERLGWGRHPWVANLLGKMSTNLLMQGHFDDALAVIDQAPTFGPMQGRGVLNPDRYKRMLVWQRAAVHLGRGDAAVALNALEGNAPASGELTSDIAYYDELMGEALCAHGQFASGAVRLDRAIRFDAASYVYAPWSARLRVISGSCVLALGQRRAAMLLAKQARAALTAQPDVSPYYKAPLFKLERALGLRLPPI